MFEDYENRQQTRATWYRPIGILCTVVSLGVAAWRCSLLTDHHRNYSGYSNYAPPSASAPAWQRLELPGMSIEAPGFAAPTGSYLDGAIEGSPPDDFAINWSPGAISDAPLRTSIANAVIERANHRFGIHDTKEIVLAGEPAFELVFTPASALGDTPVLTLTFGTCGGREVQIIVGGRSVVASTARMLDSFRCTPDATQDMTRSGVVVEPTPGWHRVHGEGLVLVDAAGVRVITADLGDQSGTVADEVAFAFKSTHYRLNKPKTRGDKVYWTGVLESDGQTIPSAFIGWRCADRRIAVVVVAAPPGLSVEHGMAVAETGRCIGPKDPMPVYPSSADDERARPRR